jgi:hypothetical protein
VLLYWDAVGTIIPRSLVDVDPVVGNYTSELMQAGLVRPVSPARHIHRVDGFADRFFAVIDGDEGILERRGRALEEKRTLSRIHEEKFTDEIFDGLHERQLGVRSNDWGWWDVESQTAGVYMAYLAATLGALAELKMDPVSDRTDFFVSTAETPVARAEALRSSFLDAILPGPEGPVAVQDLVTFKERHVDTLRAFRTAVESELLRLALIEDNDARVREKTLTEDRLRQEIDAIAAAMRKRRWPKIVFGSIAGIASVAAAATAAAATGGAALAFAAPGVISGAYAAVEGFPRRSISDSPLIFAACAHKAFAA